MLQLELQAGKGDCPVPQSHDLPLGRMPSRLQAIGQGTLPDQTVVAHCVERAGHALENACLVVVDGAGFAMHQPRRPADLAAKRGRN